MSIYKEKLDIYKIRITGVRDNKQLDRILKFMNTLIYLYTETYLYKKPERQKMITKFQKITKIAKRRNKVEVIVPYESSAKLVKQITSIDSRRLKHKTDDDQNQWTRDCQNSGDDKLRRPQQFLSVDDLQALGYVWKNKLDDLNFGHYTKKVYVDEDGNTNSNKKKTEVNLRAIKLPLDDTGENFVYYTCGPEENGKHMYIGFLNKSKTTVGDAKPCCFKKDQYLSQNKKNFYLKSLGVFQEEEKEEPKISGEQLYILQNSNKIQEGRFSFLPKYLDIFMNFMMGYTKKIRNHYLVSTDTGYYLKYGPKQDEHKYLNALSFVLDISSEDLRNKLIKVLEADKHQLIFTSLNNGDVRTQFGTITSYISYIKHNDYLEYPLLNDLICLPGVLRKNGLNIIIFKKKIKRISELLEKERFKESYYAVCQNVENVDELKNSQRETIIVIKENKSYFPIVLIMKEDEESRDMEVTKTFRYETSPKNIVDHIFKYYKINCQTEFSVLINDKSAGSRTAKDTLSILKEIGKPAYQVKHQVIDSRYKCKYLILANGYIVPTIPSGSIYNINIASSLDPYLQDYSDTFNNLNEIYLEVNQKLKLKPVGIFYTEKKEKNYLVTAIMTESYDIVPIKNKTITGEYIKKERLLIQKRSDDDLLDKEILKGPKNMVIDERVYQVSKNKYETELYQLFRYHLSYYLNSIPAGTKYKEKIETTIDNTKLSKDNKRLEIKKLLYQMTSAELAKTFTELIKKVKSPTFVTEKIYNQDNEEAIDTNLPANPLSQANAPIQISPEEKDYFSDKEIPAGATSVEIIPRDFNTRDKRPRRETVESPEFDFKESINPTTSHPFIRSGTPRIQHTNFPFNEKHWLHVLPTHKQLDYPAYVLKNTRDLCYNNTDKEGCTERPYCHWNNTKNMCMFSVKQDSLIDFINQVSEEFVQNELKAHEILRKGEYFVSDIVSYNVYTERPGERIIMSSNTNIEKILSEIFGKKNIPKIGRKRNKLEINQNYDQLNIDNPLKEIHNWLVQEVVDNNNSIFRAFANTYFWLMHPYNETSYRNLGYYNQLQTTLSNIYKSQVVDWLLSSENKDQIQKLQPYIATDVNDFIDKLNNDIRITSDSTVELYILSNIYKVIIIIYNETFDIIRIYHPQHGIVSDVSKYAGYSKIINIRFRYISKNSYPDKIDAIYLK